MKKRLVIAILAIVAVLLPKSMWAQTAYAVLTDNETVISESEAGITYGKTLRFYYDGNMADSDYPVTAFQSADERGWTNDAPSISAVAFDVSFANYSPTSTAYWFSGMTALQTLDLSSLNMASVTNADGMFTSCIRLTTITVNTTWPVLETTFGATGETANITGTDMFNGCRSLVGGAGTQYNPEYVGYSYAHIDGGTDDPGYFTAAAQGEPEAYAVLSEDQTTLTFYYDDQKEARGGMSVGPFHQNIYARGWYSSAGNVTKVVFDSSMDTYVGLTSTYLWFDEMNSLTTIENIQYLHTQNVTSMANMFSGCANLTNLDVTGFDTQNVNDMTGMFNGCTSLTSLDVTGFNTQNVTGMSGMFRSCSNLTSLDVTGFNTQNVTGMHEMFEGCSGLTSLNLSSFNTQNVNDMTDMFRNCTSLTTIYVGNGWSTINVAVGYDMFTGCTSLVGGAGTTYSADNTNYTYARIDGGPDSEIPGYFTDANAATIEPYAVLSDNSTVLTFYYDDQKEARNGMSVGSQTVTFNDDWTHTVTGRDWEDAVSSITTAIFDPSFANCTTLTTIAGLFCDNTNLTNIQGIENLRTDNVTDMMGLFWECSSLTSLDLSHFNVEQVIQFDHMLSGCSQLRYVNLDGWSNSIVQSMGDVFFGCSSLTSIDVSGFNTQNVASMNGMFRNCSNLRTIYAGSGWSTISVTRSEGMFDSCTNLVGGAGTTFNSSYTDHTYAHIDGGTGNPGYFTDKNAAEDFTFDSNGVLTVNGSMTMEEVLKRYDNPQAVTALVWNSSAALTESDLASFTNPNMLVYLQQDSVSLENVQLYYRDNVVFNRTARNVVLTNDYEGNCNFYCPREFTAQSISYSHNFTQRTEPGISRGWETLALPFDVQNIIHEKNGDIAPFGNDASNKHFWLRAIGEGGLVRATQIEANTPYLISMPNNESYADAFNQAGRVTFSSSNILVPATQVNSREFTTADGTMIVVIPTFQQQTASEQTYALNVGQAVDSFPEGSVFMQNYRDVKPFEVFTFHEGGQRPAPHYISLKDLNDATGIEELTVDRPSTGRRYDLNGRQLQGAPAGKGIYIYNGKKVVK